MNVKKDVHQAVLKMLDRKLSELRYEVDSNRRKINALVYTQTLAKRSLAEFGKLHREYSGKGVK